ncbi:TlpA family protein disulfide reductase [Ulvibacter litoralis]|uniref:Thiol-disulfide isomerase or thioredoxin n=1 Tax=Ulvibacter litoralis TaxID=227084 RepID=A0A1G7FRM4_9FLAO|nr:TlpA disulfide reductase family protein [Ulvibacter litoralis]GHC63753.1 hypothetical protein GCM10008083_31340 [Ulvibacter litoralis]SDE78596.1 Thiol-disulfide isomerase or thioredoxin [Ulvibacter litoralis]
MKNILLVFSAIALFSCSEQPKDFVTFSGKITDKNSDSIVIRTREFSKTIAVQQDGTFSDTLNVTPGIYNFYDGGESTNLFLKNGYNIHMTLDTKQFDESATYTGEGAESSNFLAQKSLLEEKLMDKDFNDLDEKGLDTTFAAIKTQLVDFINSAKNVDPIVTSSSLESVDAIIEGNKGYFASIVALRKELPKGSPAPTFENFENYDGSTTSLSDLKGKYTYIDVWATWCGPCKVEIPALKQLEKDYHDKNITFVSMSIDDDRSHKGSWDLAKSDWKAMIADENLSGVQIFAPEGWKTQFIRDFRINGIPRFILLDPEGNIVDASAPRPSDPKLRTVLEELL